MWALLSAPREGVLNVLRRVVQAPKRRRQQLEQTQDESRRPSARSTDGVVAPYSSRTTLGVGSSYIWTAHMNENLDAAHHSSNG